MSPTLGRAVCLAQVDPAHAAPGTVLTVRLPDGRRIPARVTERPAHVDPEGKRLRPPQTGPIGPPRECGPAVARSPVTLARSRTNIRARTPTEVGVSAPVLVCELADLSAVPKILVRAAPHGSVAGALGVRFGRTGRDGDVLVIGSGPGEWLVLGEPDVARLERLVAASGEFASVVDLTHGRALLRLTGPGAADLLARVCALDLSDDAVPDGAALRTSVAGVVTDLVRDDVRGVRSYLLHCERSSGQYLADRLMEGP
jgi:sarcosine oxidase subunit alpha